MSAAAVDSVTALMANTTLNQANSGTEAVNGGAGSNQATNASQNEAVIKSAAEGRRLYIGNVAYAATEGELKEFFKEYLTETTSIPINPRNGRPVGYAFVDVSTPSEAERAINELNGKTILDRKVSVQLARKPDEPPVEAATEEVNGEGRRRGSGRGRGRARGRGGRTGRGGRARAPAENGVVDGPTNVPAQVTPLVETTNEALTAERGTEGTSANKGPRPQRNRTRGPPEDGVPSKSKVMVANLPYDLREDKLLEMFKDFSPTTAKLALRPIPRFMVKKLQARNEPRKGRGFAFVTLGSEELQRKAIAEMNGKEVDGRELAVKVAIDSPGKEDADSLDAQADAMDGKENGAPSKVVEATAN